MRGLAVVSACVGIAGVWVLPILAAEHETRIELDLKDDDDRSIERASVTFENRRGDVVSVQALASRRWIPVAPAPTDERWGEDVARVRVRAFACDREAAAVVERETRGALLGRLAPHPTPRTHVYIVRAVIRCPSATQTTGVGLALSRLVDDLSAGEPWSYAAARELIRVGPSAAPALPALLEIFEATPELVLRVSLARAFGAMGSRAGAAVPSLAGLLGDADPSLRRVAASALESIGAPVPGVVGALATAARRDSDKHTQEHILRILGRMAHDARAAEADLVAILESEDEEDAVRRAAFWALGRLETESATDAQRRYAAVHPILW